MLDNRIYVEKGFKDRNAYLDNLASSYGVSDEVVYSLADMLGPNEDFDGLINALEDALCEGIF